MNPVKNIYYWLFVAVFICINAGALHSAVYYVATNGDDARTVVEAQDPATPWKTIAKAAGNVTPGDTVIIRQGTYVESVSSAVNGTQADRITYAGMVGETAYISGAIDTNVFSKTTGCTYVYELTLDSPVFSVWEDTIYLYSRKTDTMSVDATSGSFYCDSPAKKTYIHTISNDTPGLHLMKLGVKYTAFAVGTYTVFKDLIFINYAAPSSGDPNRRMFNSYNDSMTFTGCRFLYNNNYWRYSMYGNSVEGCTFIGNKGDLMYGWWDSVKNNVVRNNYFYDNANLIYFRASDGMNNYFENNVFDSNAGYCIMANVSMDSSVVRRNVFTRNAGISVYLAGGVNDSWIVENNVFYNNKTSAVYFTSPGDWGKCRNNVIYKNAGYGIYTLDPRTTSDYNLLVMNTSGENVAYGQNDIRNQDPFFMDEYMYDFRLKPNSPCIDAGDSDSFYNDADGTRGDIGVYYYDKLSSNAVNVSASAGRLRITLSWTNPSGNLGGISLIKRTDRYALSETDGNCVYAGMASDFADTDVQYNTPYYYSIFAYDNTVGTGKPRYTYSPTANITATCGDANPPSWSKTMNAARYVEYKADGTWNYCVDLSWDLAQDDISVSLVYEIEHRQGSGDWGVLATLTDTDSIRLQNLNGFAEHRFRVRIKDEAGNYSGYSEEKQVSFESMYQGEGIIGQEGGEVTMDNLYDSAAKETKIVINKGNFSKNHRIRIARISEFEFEIKVYEENWNERKVTLLGKGAILTLKYNYELVGKLGWKEDNLAVYRRDTKKWIPLGGVVNKEKKTVTVAIDHLSTFKVESYDRTKDAGIMDAQLTPEVITPNGDNINDISAITFSVGDELMGREIVVAVYDIDGKTVRKFVVTVQSSSGIQYTAWDGRDNGGNLCEAGFYILEIDGGLGRRSYRNVTVAK